MRSPVVETLSGSVVGSVVEPAIGPYGPIRVFRGIPYAAPTSGNGRFAAPGPVAGWAGVREAKEFAPVAPQQPSPLDKMFGARELRTGEDCLALNIWTPGLDRARRPVMVWVHGGAFTTGSGGVPFYDGARFAENHDIVSVTINYRLGVLGFTHVDGDRDDTLGSGNAGLLDQIAALAWVRDNIAEFGGDPANVTVFGESAGAMSIGTLLGTPGAKGLFRRAILQSGAAAHVRSSDAASDATRFLLDFFGIAGSADAVTSLQALPVETLLRAQDALVARRASTGVLQFGPVVDGTILERSPLNAVAAAAAAGIEVVVGTNADEMRLFTIADPGVAALDRAGIERRLKARLGDRAAAATDAYLTARPGRSPADVWPDISGDQVFRYPAHQLLSAQHPHAAAAWSYEFRWPTPVFKGRLGSCHALEIPFVFDNLHQPGSAQFTGDGLERQPLATAMHGAWATFARTGNPATELVSWPQWTPDQRATMIFDSTLSVADRPGQQELEFWQ